jgi:hypothetical protein
MGLYLLQGAWTWILKCQIDNTFKVQCIMHVGKSIDNARKWNHSVIVRLELIKIAKMKCSFFLLNLASCFMVPSSDQGHYQRPWGSCWNVSRYGHKYETSI